MREVGAKTRIEYLVFELHSFNTGRVCRIKLLVKVVVRLMSARHWALRIVDNFRLVTGEILQYTDPDF